MKTYHTTVIRPTTSPNQGDEKVAQRLRAMFGMHDAGVEMMRYRLKRTHPDAMPKQINQSISTELHANRFDPSFSKNAHAQDSRQHPEPSVESAQHIEVFDGITLPTVPYLIAIKSLAESDRRLQDRIDLQSGIAVATAEDLSIVPDLLNHITERGFADGKQLQPVFEKFLAEHEDEIR